MKRNVRIALMAAMPVVFAAVFLLCWLDFRPNASPTKNLWTLVYFYWVPFIVVWCALTVWVVRHRDDRGGAMLIVAIALAARLMVVGGATPQLSDDLWRYIHDGRTLGGGEQPYAQSPTEVGGDPRINHPDLVTIYQPASQWVFAAAAIVAEVTGVTAHGVFRLAFVLFDMAVVLLLLRALSDRGRSAWWAALYAWHPLAISEVAGSGHQEPIGIAMLLAALLLAERSRVTVARAVLGGAAFAIAVAVKPIVLPLAIPLAWSLRDRRATLACATGAAASMGMALYLPFAIWEPGLANMRQTVSIFMRDWAFNSSIHGVLNYFTDNKPFTDRVLAGALLGVLAVCLRKGYEPTRTAMVYLFAALLLSSTVHPWYLLWALAFVPLHFSAALWVWSLTVIACYAVLRDRAAWYLPPWIVWCEYTPVYYLLAWSAVRGLRKTHDPTSRDKMLT